MSEQEMEAPVAVFRHAVTVYMEMAAQGTVIQAEDSNMLVYEGKLVELVVDTCGLSVPYYTKVTQALKGMGCARQLRRGGGSSPSQWELIREPTPELWQAYLNSADPEDTTEYAPMQTVRDLSTRIKRIEKAIGIIT